jgi:hypothetical protein
MRLLIGAAMIVAALGCSSSDSVSPDISTINVRVFDDAGGPVNRTRIIVTMGSDRIEELTNAKGLASIRVENAGEYSVRVLPRIGYAGGSGLIQKSVTVNTGSFDVAFHLSRDGMTQAQPGTPYTPTQTWW